MFHGLSKALWNFFEKEGISPWYLIILVWLFAGYVQIPVLKNWKNSSTYQKYYASGFIIMTLMLIIFGIFTWINGLSL
jgi:hypothetical protein